MRASSIRDFSLAMAFDDLASTRDYIDTRKRACFQREIVPNPPDGESPIQKSEGDKAAGFR